MKRSWNLSLWFGFVFVVLGFFSYPFFIRFPATRDFPWANFVLFAAGTVLLWIGLKRAFGVSAAYRGKVFGSIFAVLSLCLIAFFSFLFFHELKQLPESKNAPRVGERAPDFILPDLDNKPVALTDLISSSSGKPGAAVLIFYRGFW